MPFVCRKVSLQGARGHNEDALRHFSLGQDCFAVLCDGLGGYPDGGWAARTFADAVEQAVTRFIPADDTTPEQALHEWLQRAWQQFCSEQQQQQRDPQAQTTFVLAWASNTFTLITHVGDSRAYVLDGQRIHWRSRDHNLYELGVLNGDIDPQVTPRAQGQQTLLYRTVSSQRALKPTLQLLPALVVGQCVVLCSDGAWHPLQDQDWLTLAQSDDVGRDLHALLQRAVTLAGSKADNASAVVVRAE